MTLDNALKLNPGKSVSINYNNSNWNEKIRCSGTVVYVDQTIHKTCNGLEYIWITVEYRYRNQLKQSTFASHHIN